MPTGPRALVFDFDGVIADSEPAHLAAFRQVLAAEGISRSTDDYYARYLGFDDHDAIVEALRDAGRPPTPDVVRALMARKAEAFLALVGTAVHLTGVPASSAPPPPVPLAIAPAPPSRSALIPPPPISRAFTAIGSAETSHPANPTPRFIKSCPGAQAAFPSLSPTD